MRSKNYFILIQKQRQSNLILTTSTMSNFDKILNEFRMLGYNQESYLQQNQINRALDAIATKNAQINQFDRSIAEELWQHSMPDNFRGVRLADYINSIVEAQNLLRQQLNYTQTALKRQNDPMKRAPLQDQYNQIVMDHQVIITPFRLAPLRPGLAVQTSGLLPNHQASQRSRLGQTVIFTDKPNLNEESSTDLKICLIIAIVMLAFELVLMFSKHHFLNLLCIFGVLSIFFLNYFDKNYMKFLLIILAASIVLDVVWLVLHVVDYWNPHPQTQYSTLHSGFLVFTYIMVIVQGALKIVMIGILFKYRNNDESFKKNVSALGYRIKLDGRPTYNPFSPLLRAAPYINQI